MAVSVRFELTSPFGLSPFQGGALSHSANSLSGAQEETRTPTLLGTATSTLRVYQFHH